MPVMIGIDSTRDRTLRRRIVDIPVTRHGARSIRSNWSCVDLLSRMDAIPVCLMEDETGFQRARVSTLCDRAHVPCRIALIHASAMRQVAGFSATV